MNYFSFKWHYRHVLSFTLAVIYCCFSLLFSLPNQAAEGELIWQTRLAISYQDYYTNNEGHLAVAPSGEVIANQASYLYAFNTDGSQKWRKSLPNTVYRGVPVIGSDGTIYTGSGLTYYRAKKFGVIAYNPDGTIKWNRSDLSTSQIAVDNSNIVYLYDDKSLYALNADGSDKWQLSLAGGKGSPVIAADGTIYIRSSNHVFAISAIGRLLWTYVAEANISTSLAISADGAIVFSDEEKSLVMLNGDGTVKQQKTLSALPFGSPIIAKDNCLYFATADKGILALAADGTKKWSYPTNDSASSLLLLQDGSLTFIVDNKLISLASDGQLNWQVVIEGQNSNIASDGSLYIHGLFVSFDPDSGRPHPYGLLTAFESSAGGLAASPWPKMAGNVKNSGLDTNAGLPTNNYDIDFETAKLDQAPMYLSGDSHWQVSDDKVKTGNYALKSPILTSENQQAIFEISTVTKNHYLTFDFSVNTIQVDQQLSFYVDNVLKGRWYGELGWQSFELAVEAGVHTFSWKFLSATALTGTQAAWLDNIHIVYSTDDVDSDGIADHRDDDNDNDGIIDNLDEQPLNASLSADYDRDGISDVLDIDDDNDGVNDDADLAPYDKNIGINSGDGLMLSSFQTMSGNILSSPAIADDGSIYIGSTDGRLYAFDNKGELKWYYQSQDIITASPVIGDDGTIYIGSYDKNLYALNADGSLKWQVDIMTYIDTAPAIHPNGNIFIQAHGLTILNSAGEILEHWLNFSFCPRNMASPSISPQGDIYRTYQQAYARGDYGGKLMINQSDGSTIASVRASTGASPAISADGTLYISNNYTHYDSSHFDFNPKTARLLTAYTAKGIKKWTTTFPESGGGLTSAVIANNNLIYMGADKFYALNADGEILWLMATDHEDDFFTSTPTIAADGTIFIGASDHQLYAINPDGTKKWSFKTSGTILSSPTISPDGHVVFGSNDGRLYILNSDAGALAETPWPMLGQNLTNSRFLLQDTDGDGEYDHLDSDDDNDGVVDSEDALIYDAVDTDGDGQTNILDDDDDNDGVLDVDDAFPIDASESIDTDGDGIGNNADTDDDNDGIYDEDDSAPLDVSVGDAQAPIFALLDDLVIEATGNTTELSAHLPEVTDNSYHKAIVVASINELTLGEHVITWTATDYNGNQAAVEQRIAIVDTTPPLLDIADDISIKAQGYYSAINLKAFDLVDGDIQVEVNGENKYLSGRHHVEIIATDNSGNSSSKSITVNILPELSIATNMQVEAQGRYAITAHLGGLAVQYPVPLCIYLRRDGNIISTDCTASIESGRQATHWFVLRDVMELSVNSELLLEYEVGEYAYVGDNGVTKLTIVEHNSVPRLNIVIRQNNELVSLIDPTKGMVTLVAQIDDVNSADGHDVTWHIDERIESNSVLLYGIYNNEPSVSFYPENLVDGQYVINVRVAENNTAEALHVNRDIYLSVGHSAELSADNDSDNDGVSDKDEGLKDSDGDGIRDYLDNNINTTQLPVSHSFDVMHIAAGNKLSLGSYVQAFFKTASQSVNITVEELSTVINDITNAADVDFEAITPAYNFTVREIQTTETLPMTIVLPLPSNLKLPNESFYRVFNKVLGWQGFVENANNRISSAPADELGNCPKINSILYLVGLNAGDNCVQLAITDGDSNDADGLNNGVVDFLGAIAIATEISNHAPNIAIDNHDSSYDENSQVTITVQASDADGDNLIYQWSQISGPTISLTNANSAQVSFTLAQVSKDEMIELQVNASDGQLSGTAQTSFTVKNVAAVKPTTPVVENSSGGGVIYWLLLMVFFVLVFKAYFKLRAQV